jgi:PAS domain S-box-containing protein
LATEFRKTGISVIGDVPWGTHFCTFYETTQDLLDILVPFFKVGLESKEFCLWIISNSDLLTVPEATRALRKALPDLGRHLTEGNIELVNHDEWFLEKGLFDFKQVAGRFEHKVNGALAKGYVGMRVNGSPAWLYHNDDDKDLVVFEEEVDKLYPSLRVIASCTYPIGGSGAAELLDIARAHQFVLSRRRGRWQILETPELLQARSELKNLRRIESEVRLVVDTIPANVWCALPDGAVDFANKRLLKVLGVSSQQLMGWNWTTVVHPDDIDGFVNKWREALATGQPMESEARLRYPNGEYRWYLIRNVPLIDDKGNILRWYGTGVDINEGRLVREALQESEAKLKEAQRLAHIGYWERDLLADRITVSESTSLILGFSERVFTHAELQAMVHPDDRAAQERALHDALQGKHRYDHEFRIVLSDRQVRFIHAWDEIAYDESGRPVRMFGTVQDITELKRAENALRESQQLLQLVLATLPVGVAVINHSGDIVLVNNASKRIWGGDTIVSGERRWVQSIGFWHDSGDRIAPKEWASVRALLNGETSLNELIDIETYDGQQKIMQNSAAPIRRDEGKIVGAVIVNEDVTERVRAEEQLKRYNRELRALSARLHSVREEESTRIAREIHDELGGSLTSLRWDLEEVGEAIAEAKAIEQVAVLGKKIEAMMSLTEATLDTVRRLSSELRPMALDELGLVEAIEWQARQFESRTGIAVQYKSSVEKIDLNSEQSIAVFRILQEALTNILRHAGATDVTIQLKQDGGEFSLTIEDNGRGFTENEKSDAQSLGILGMRERAHLMGGAIKIEGAEGRGTKIILHIPITS